MIRRVTCLETLNEHTPFFTTDIASEYVTAQLAVGVPVLADGETFKRSQISYNEGVLLQSAYIRLPHQFTIAVGHIHVAIGAYFNNVAAPSPFGEGDSQFQLPIENTEIIFGSGESNGVWIPPPETAIAAKGKWNLQANLILSDPVYISMINVPEMLDTTLQRIYIGVKILHGIPLTAI